jgi:hypothetical protein
VIKDITDEAFFLDHPDRSYHIRTPVGREYEREFRTLGLHLVERRRVLVKKLDPARARIARMKVITLPFLAFADETIADRDDVLAPIFRGILEEAARTEGLQVVF